MFADTRVKVCHSSVFRSTHYRILLVLNVLLFAESCVLPGKLRPYILFRNNVRVHVPYAYGKISHMHSTIVVVFENQ